MSIHLTEGSNMSSWGVLAPDDEPRVQRRVREEVRDGVAVCACSIGASTLLAIALLLVTKLAG